MLAKLSFIFTSDGLYTGIWKKSEEIQNIKLKQTAQTLPLLIEAACADSTLYKYRNAWRKWLNWTSNYPEVMHCPADPFFVAIYFNELLLTNSTISCLTSAYCGIRWAHLTAGVESPTEHPFVKMAFEGAKRLTPGSKSNQKEPLTPNMIRELVSLYGSSGNLIHMRFLVTSLLGFAGFFRISELLAV